MSTLSLISVIDASIRAATDNLLSSHGYLVDTFASAEDFLRSAHLDDSLCVVADVQRTLGNDTPFVFITAFPDESVRARALKAGAI